MKSKLNKLTDLGLDKETSIKLAQEQVKREELQFNQRLYKEERIVTKYDGVKQILNNSPGIKPQTPQITALQPF